MNISACLATAPHLNRARGGLSSVEHLLKAILLSLAGQVGHDVHQVIQGHTLVALDPARQQQSCA
jgi:hypothetical protein